MGQRLRQEEGGRNNNSKTRCNIAVASQGGEGVETLGNIFFKYLRICSGINCGL